VPLRARETPWRSPRRSTARWQCRRRGLAFLQAAWLLRRGSWGSPVAVDAQPRPAVRQARVHEDLRRDFISLTWRISAASLTARCDCKSTPQLAYLYLNVTTKSYQRHIIDVSF